MFFARSLRLFQGDYCEIKFNECENIDCHNGTCKNLESEGFNCECSPGYVGTYCEIDIDDCANNPCEGEGSYCHDKGQIEFKKNLDNSFYLVNGFDCDCQDGLTGDQCEINIDDCEPDPCEHGKCFDKIGDYECQCEPGYEGTQCEKNIDDCRADSCLNGGECQDLVNDFFCNCKPGFQVNH